MLTFYRSPKLELLADELVEVYSEKPLADPLEEEIVIVQNHGMAQWLSKRIARTTGISGNVEFPFPAEKIWDFYRTMDETIPKDLPSDREPMTWAVYSLLQDISDQSPYKSVWYYIRGDNGELNSLKTWKLATRIGDLYDQYLIYRPKMMLNWENDEYNASVAQEVWQADLWNRLQSRWQKTYPDLRWMHRAAIHRDFMQALRNGDIDRKKLPERLTFFGLSGMPPASIDAFVHLSRLVDIHWFWMDPAAGSPFGPLKESWGGEGQEFLSLFREAIKKSRVNIEEIHLEDEENEKGTKPSQLAESQTLDLFALTLGLRETSLPVVQIHSCHSEQREVEVLHDNILELFNSNPDLEPDDILILAPDIQRYAPFIKGVFGTTEEGQPAIPFHVVDDKSGPQKEVFNVFSKFLNLLESRFKVSEVLDLLSSSVIRQRFDISEDELDRLYIWIDETNIHWGLDGKDKAKMGLPSSGQFTWFYGLDRLMMGFSSQLEDETFDGIYPFEQVEGRDDADLLGKFSRFLNALRQARVDVRAPQKMDRWLSLFSGWIDSFIPSNGDYVHAYNGLKRVVDDLQQAASLAGFERDLEYTVLLDYLDDKLSMAASRGGYFGHGITFSGLEQMRNIPSPVIGMIGMNNEAFPRTKVSPDFDLMTRNSQPGDRSRRNDDRYLFLEEMQSARDHFYLSYVGQSNRDDSKRPPSVMISELSDYLRDPEEEEDDLKIQHPLHPYSRKYFTGEKSKLFSYSRSMYTVSKTISEEQRNQPIFFEDSDRLPEADDTFTQVSLKELVQFFEHPCRFLVQNRLGIDFREEDVIDEDREPFQLGGLRNYQLGQELLDRTLAEKPISNYEAIARARGILPDGWPGREAFQEKVREINEYSEDLKQLLASEKMESVEVDLDLGRYHLSGRLDSIYADYQLLFRYGKLRGKDLLRLWIYHLVFQMTDGLNHSYQSIMVGKEGRQPLFAHIPKLDDAESILHDLIETYWKGLHQKIPLFTETSYKFAKNLLEKDYDPNRALANAKYQEWISSKYNKWAEDADPNINILFKTSEPVDSHEFKDISLELWKPIISHIKIVEALHG